MSMFRLNPDMALQSYMDIHNKTAAGIAFEWWLRDMTWDITYIRFHDTIAMESVMGDR